MKKMKYNNFLMVQLKLMELQPHITHSNKIITGLLETIDMVQQIQDIGVLSLKTTLWELLLLFGSLNMLKLVSDGIEFFRL